MKKILSLAMMSAALFLAACTDDDTVATQTQDDTSVVTFTVSQSGIQTRAFSDGTSASTLYYEVYQVTDEALTYVEGISGSIEEAFDESLQATVTLQLVNGNEYEIIFWAQSPDTEVYSCTWNSETPSVTINTEELTSNVEDYDAFYNTYETGVVTGDISETIYLYRPFAQLNWGTNDLTAVEAAGVTDIQTSVTISVSGVGNKLYFADGTVEMAEDAVTFATADIPEGETFPVDGYEYVNMNYILFTADKATVDASLTVTGTNLEEHVVEVPQVPLQRNYRTNIYGSLLTSTANFVIEIVPEYEEPDTDMNLDYVEVSTADELSQALANGVDTIVLLNNITADELIEISGDDDVTIDVGDNTLTTSEEIYVSDGASLTITGDEDGDGELVFTDDSYIVTVGEGSTLTIENVTITNTGSSTGNAAVQIGASNTSSDDNTLIMTNVTIESETKTGLQLVGGTTVTLTNCSITGGYFGITQNGTGNDNVIPGSTITLVDTDVTGKYSGIYLSTSYSTNYTGNTSTLTITGGTITSEEETAIEVKRTNLTVSGATLVSKYTGAQKYNISGSGSNSYGYGITLAGYTNSTAYEGDVSLSNITYNLSSSANTNAGSTWNVAKFVEANTTGTAPDGATLTGTKTSTSNSTTTTTYTYATQVTDDGATE